MSVAGEEPGGRGAGRPTAEDGDVDRFARVRHDAIKSTPWPREFVVRLAVVGLVLSSAMSAASSL